MDPMRRTSFYFGLWFIGTFVFSIPAFFLYDPILNDADYILGSGADTQVAAGALLEILLSIANIATAVVLYRVARRIHESVALGYVALRIIESAIILIGVVSIMSVVTLREDLAGSDANAETLSLVGQSLVAVHEWTRVLGPQFCAAFGNGILLGYLMYKSGLVPRPMAMLGLFVGGPLALLAGLLLLFGAGDPRSGPLVLLTIPEIVWEAFIAIYCTWKGFRPSPLLADLGPPPGLRSA
jgi:Domain of unknown function (DUF4386)